jgi:hypothetical protein
VNGSQALLVAPVKATNVAAVTANSHQFGWGERFIKARHGLLIFVGREDQDGHDAEASK